MRLRLPRWLRRDPAPLGRHMRGMAPVAVPGAAATLVASVAEPFLAPEPPAAPADEAPAADPSSVAARAAEAAAYADPLDDTLVGGLVPVLVPVEDLPSEPSVMTDRDADPEPHTNVAVEPVTHGEIGADEPLGEPATPAPTVAEPTVALGFADGELLELAADDPRAAGFRDVAAAVLGHDAG